MHEEIVLQWVTSCSAAREMAFLNAWFFLELMANFFSYLFYLIYVQFLKTSIKNVIKLMFQVKSMAEYLSISNRLYLPRKLRFSETFIQDLNVLSFAIIAEVIARAAKDPRQVSTYNVFYESFSVLP